MNRRTVSIWTVAGRIARIPFACSDAQHAALAAHRQGESDLVYRGGKWFLYATCQIYEPEPAEPDGFLGIDLGITNIVTTSDGIRHAGTHLNRVRRRNRALRRKLQAKGTKSAKRLLRKRSRKETRLVADTNHRIAKSIVTEAQRTCRGIALEDLQGIRNRVRLGVPSGPRCTRGRLLNSAGSLPTRRCWPAFRWCTSIRRTPLRCAHRAGTSIRETDRTRRRSAACRAASLSMPT